jgi:hypothetical protein
VSADFYQTARRNIPDDGRRIKGARFLPGRYYVFQHATYDSYVHLGRIVSIISFYSQVPQSNGHSTYAIVNKCLIVSDVCEGDQYRSRSFHSFETYSSE